MKATLEQLKAMSDNDLSMMWLSGDFPFDFMDGCGCLLQHQDSYIKTCTHKELRREMDHLPEIIPCGSEIRPHLEQLYALRAFYDSLYPQPESSEALAAQEAPAEVVTNAL